MCLQEYIQYQCGHRSTSVVRPCPATTAGMQFPVCTHQATWASIAKTMCALCERIIHCRWVLIREWEHRWLHERGACGCDIFFPGVQFRPRVAGAPWGTSNPHEMGGIGTQSQRYIAPFSEQLNWNGRVLNPVRIPGLYAAEWICDHRVLHRTGRCKCRADFRIFQATVSESDFNPEEKSVIEKYRKMGDVESGSRPAKMEGFYEAVGTPIPSGSGNVWALPSRPKVAHHSQISAPSPGSIASPASTAAHPPSTATVSTMPMSTVLTDNAPPWRNMQREYLAQSIPPSVLAEKTPCGLAGLPIGAGPEGQVHMPSFYAECRLSRPMPKRRRSM